MILSDETPEIAASSTSHICGCLTASADRQPELEPHFAERAGVLVRELAQKLTDFPDITTPEGFGEFCRENSIHIDSLESSLHSVRISPHLQNQQALLDYLVDDFRLLEKWIISQKGPEYPGMLFGNYRCAPFFANDRSVIPAAEFLDQMSAGLTPPFSTLLVQEKDQLKIGRKLNPSTLERIVGNYPDFFVWVLIFSQHL